MNNSSNRAAPPRLHFDDGRRIMEDQHQGKTSSHNNNNVVDIITDDDDYDDDAGKRNQHVSVAEYYEIDRVCEEIIVKLNLTDKLLKNNRGMMSSSEVVDHHHDGEMFLCKVALQFPDYLLEDAPEVTWLIEEQLSRTSQKLQEEEEEEIVTDLTPLVFVLGDTSYGACCVDEVAALHLSADIVVHYGRACLTPTQNMPVIYSFGYGSFIDIDHCVDSIVNAAAAGSERIKLLVLYDVIYHHAINPLCARLQQSFDSLTFGHIPSYNSSSSRVMMLPKRQPASTISGGCPCGKANMNSKTAVTAEASCARAANNQNVVESTPPERARKWIVGSLEVDAIVEKHLSEYTILYIGDEGPQMTNILLRCNSTAATIWAYKPCSSRSRKDHVGIFNHNAGSSSNKALNRRFFLTEKARMANIIGIVVGTLSVASFREVVERAHKQIEDAGKTCYTFVVGKINVAKLANYAEIETFVLVACPENSLLDSREFHVPIITPFELEISLGLREWSGEYTTGFDDLFKNIEIEEENNFKNKDKNEDGVDVDAPFFSVVSGGYVKAANKRNSDKSEELDLQATVGKGQVIKYQSGAADFLKSREYQGLQSHVGETPVEPAKKGHYGIASDYGNR